MLEKRQAANAYGTQNQTSMSVYRNMMCSFVFAVGTIDGVFVDESGRLRCLETSRIYKSIEHSMSSLASEHVVSESVTSSFDSVDAVESE